MIRARAAALASDPEAESAANAVLAAGGGALDAALAGFFVAGAAVPEVLLCPLEVWLAGIGEGARAFDGRPRQPGRGTRRPRGFADVEKIPEASRVGVPASLATLLFAHAYGTGRGLRGLFTPAIQLARRRGALARAALLDRLAAVGAAALLEPAYRRPLLRVGSPSEGGLVTPRDLEPDELVAEALSARRLGDDEWLLGPERQGEGRRAAGVLAVDAHGAFAAVAYRPIERGVPVEELELVAPALASPVLRGVPRVAPGTRLGPGFALALRLDPRQRPHELVFEPNRSVFGADGPDAERLSLTRDPDTRLVAARG